MLNLSIQETLALSSSTVPLCLLIRLDLAVPLYLSTAGVDVEWGGNVWLGVGNVGAVDPVNDSLGERQPLRMSLSSVPNEMLALALSESVRNKRCKFYLAIHDPDTYQIISARICWTGNIDSMAISEGADSGSVTLTAEHRQVTFARPKPLRYTDGDQRRLYPGDLSLQYMVSQSTHQDVWPAASWGKK